jgi:hypothetical protein
MTQRVAVAEAKAVPPISEAEHGARVAAVEADRSRAVAQLEELTQEAGQLNSEQAALGQRQHALAAQRQQADESTRKTETELRCVPVPPARVEGVCLQNNSLSRSCAPHLTRAPNRQHLQLYKLLTGVSWDTAHIQDGRVKGHVLDTARADVRPFDLDATSMDAVAVADELWAQVAAF